MKTITVFGGSQPAPGEPAYEEALRLGRLLGEAGYAVATGGYIGTMEAVSRGAAEAGGHVIGVTCETIEAWRPVKHNQWVAEERRFPNLFTRLVGLIEAADAAIALPGGPGTLTEIALMWNNLLTESIPARPLIVVGPGWQAVFTTLFDSLGQYIPERQRTWLHFVTDVDAAVAFLKQLL